LDEVEALRRTRADELRATAEALALRGERVLLVCGEAARGVFAELCRDWGASLADGPDAPVEPFAIRNDYYGGDVNVTGLIVACDLLAQLPTDLRRTVVVLPEVMFNFDHVTLDGDTQAHIVSELERRGAVVLIVQTTPTAVADSLLGWATQG
jgi:hypothetical protein